MSNNHFTPPQSGGGGSGITAVVQDPGPQLGGDLDCATNDIKNSNLIEMNTLDVKNGLTDAIHPGNGNFQNIVQNTGNYFNDVALTHTDLNNQYFFPSQLNWALKFLNHLMKLLKSLYCLDQYPQMR